LLGVHPTCAKMISAHVRVFSRKDTLLFYHEIASEFISLQGFYGSQFYPFPGFLARRLATILPSCAFSIFFLLKKTGAYDNQFIDHLSRVVLETNFLTGKAGEPSSTPRAQAAGSRG